jgi:2-phosphosulfolactate phosphatase
VAVEFKYLPLSVSQASAGIVVVIDVLRAFSTAAYAFSAGVDKIHPVSTVADAFSMKPRFPEARLMGEVGGLPIEGFDYGNSPASFLGQNLTGVNLIQRTSAGTQGVVSNIHANLLIASCFCCASATARYISIFDPHEVTFIITGSDSEDAGAEDLACAEFITAHIMGVKTEVEDFVNRVKGSSSAQKFLNPRKVDFPGVDLELSLLVDRFDFTMVVDRQGDLLTIKPVVV